jgi:hypothetical protein
MGADTAPLEKDQKLSVWEKRTMHLNKYLGFTPAGADVLKVFIIIDTQHLFYPCGCGCIG